MGFVALMLGKPQFPLYKKTSELRDPYRCTQTHIHFSLHSHKLGSNSTAPPPVERSAARAVFLNQYCT